MFCIHFFRKTFSVNKMFNFTHTSYGIKMWIFSPGDILFEKSFRFPTVYPKKKPNTNVDTLVLFLLISELPWLQRKITTNTQY